MRESEGLRVFVVEVQRGCDRTRHLGHFDRMSEAVSKMVAESHCKDLRLAFEPAKGTRMDDAVTITLEIAAIGMDRLGESATAQILRTQAEAVQH